MLARVELTMYVRQLLPNRSLLCTKTRCIAARIVNVAEPFRALLLCDRGHHTKVFTNPPERIEMSS